MLQCKECLRKVDLLTDTGLCLLCHNKDDLVDITPIRLPEGLIAVWNDTPSYLNKKLKRRYFNIPDTCDDRILDGTRYQIIIKEI